MDYPSKLYICMLLSNTIVVFLIRCIIRYIYVVIQIFIFKTSIEIYQTMNYKLCTNKIIANDFITTIMHNMLLSFTTLLLLKNMTLQDILGRNSPTGKRIPVRSLITAIF